MRFYTYDESFCYNGFFETPDLPPSHNPLDHTRFTDKVPPSSGPFQDVIFDPNANEWIVTADKPEKRQRSLDSAFSQKMQEINAWLDKSLAHSTLCLSSSECAIITMYAGEIRSEAAGVSENDPFLDNYIRPGKTRRESAEALSAKMDKIANEAGAFIAQADEWRDQIQALYDSGDIDAIVNFDLSV